MNWKYRSAGMASSGEKLSFNGSGKVSVPVANIVGSPKVQRQVNGVREIAAGLKSGQTSKSK